LFDLNTEQAYRLLWNDSFGIVEDDHVCVVRSSYFSLSRIAKFEGTWFYLEQEQWKRSDITLLQKCHCEAEVRTLLRDVGFRHINTYACEDSREESDGSHDIDGTTPDADRIFFVCRKTLSKGALGPHESCNLAF
jgi:hypothetical protein